jgi:hypothetical protein
LSNNFLLHSLTPRVFRSASISSTQCKFVRPFILLYVTPKVKSSGLNVRRPGWSRNLFHCSSLSIHKVSVQAFTDNTDRFWRCTSNCNVRARSSLPDIT